ncbi:Fe(3+) dicitrate ABC transporter substrate-binding protein [Poseidonocella sp. HB161398]|uniref:Fe(3+) dicitrate ABC transporter substrate-binding protein n=1 Tax=Poseidonocella sp. HB161398 TaxID=2320855 RepID=UPI001108DBBA|nr:Fe(3+) dicitrate ABC transporter substrate-binding protein [Poseidonocella sp. HB161398]
MQLLRPLAAGLLLCASSALADPITISDGSHVLELPGTPERVVALEFSFVDALASVGVSPVGVADDNDASRLPPEVREVTGDWTSVGTRAQPATETIAALKPDLIIADLDRHAASYETLSAIAPTLLLPSRGESYEESLASAEIVGHAVGRDAEMAARLELHHERMADYAAKAKAVLPGGATVIFGAAREDSLSLHGPDSYSGGVLQSLGLTVPEIREGGDAYEFVSIEQLLALDPGYLLVGHYRRPSIVDTWQDGPLWSVLGAAQQGHVVAVDSNVWARNRGIIAAEKIARTTIEILDGSYAAPQE